MKIIRSLYRGSKAEQFEMEIIGEGIDEEFNEECYICKFLPKWQPIFKNGYGIHKIRKSLVGKESLYELIEKTITIQIKLF